MLGAAALVGGLAGCATGPVDKAGGSGGITVLGLATPDSPGRPSSRDVEHFAEQVRTLSHGRLRVQVSWDVGRGGPSWDQVTARSVIDGDQDLALVPARAWDVLGVDSLRALQAPFVLTSDAALDAVVADPVAEDLMTGLDGVGVTGLALFPEGLRHPVGYGAPVLEPADLAGGSVRAPRSELTWEVLRALGADPVDLGTESDADLRSVRGLRADETSAEYAPTLPRPGVLTANVTPYAKANVLVVSHRTLAGLTDDQQAVLRQAAARTRGHSIRTRRSDVEAVASACASGLPVVLADPAQLDRWRQVTQPVRDRLAEDPTSGALLERVSAVAERVGPGPPVASCDPDATPSTGTSDLSALEGVWRFEVTVGAGVAAGLPPQRAAAELGVQTVRMSGGSYRWEWRSAEGDRSCAGTYRADGDAVVFTDEPACGGSWQARPATTAGEVTWSAVRSRATADPADQLVRELLHGVPWRRVDAATTPSEFPAGVYRWTVPEEALVAAGVDGGTAYFNSGVMTMTVGGGRWTHRTTSPADPPECSGTYEVVGGRVLFTADAVPQCGGGLLFSARWATTADGLQLDDIEPRDPFTSLVWGTPWRRLG